jgi:transcriptional regulator with XRE-family HTH domain
VVREDIIGRRIRQLRLERNMTQQVLADAAELTKGYLSRIENSPTSPPVSTLINIANALGVGIDEIFSEEAVARNYTLVRKSERQPVARPGSSFGYSYEPLALQFPNRAMDPFILTAPPNAGRSAKFVHAGQEMLFILDGVMVFHIGDDTIELKTGDCIYFDAAIPHWAEFEGNDGQSLVVLYSPEGDGDTPE